MQSRGARAKRLGPMLMGLILTIALPCRAADSDDHNRARQALEAGEILPLRTVLEKLASEMPGQVMEVELERRAERWIYEIRLLRPGGALIKLKVDARDAAIIAGREQGAKRAR